MPQVKTGHSSKTKTAQTAQALADLELDKTALPRHIAIIMDGNGRWASQRNQPRIFGHERGAKSVNKIVTQCARLELDVLTLYSFSTENWNRPVEEINFLMDLYVRYLIQERTTMMNNDVRFVQIGRRENLPDRVLEQLDETAQITAGNTGLTLALAINYGSRAEITDAVRNIANKARKGNLNPDEITEQTVTDHLYTAGLPDPDLLIRTAGEMRVSNYLLWQISYAELYITDACWPDFDVNQLHHAIREYARRVRKYGGVSD
ncbi:MAG: di-trans,poly-cis-decaprenylcistransferase [Phycisphaeraceae bacterium]|nr:di-trans,poly-cis-decaprenylcistransferase [Phycisphaeraceae bacterium]